MAVTVIQGVRDVQNLSTETRRVRDVATMLSQLEPDAGPLITLLSKLRSRSATDPKIEWFEDQLLPYFDVLAADLTAAAGTMTVTNFKYFRAGDLVKINNGEIVLVSATPTSTVVTITRAYGETAAAAANNGQQLFIISNANQENASVPAILTTQKVPVFNYLQIIRTPIGFSGTEMQTKTFGGDDKATERSKAFIEHKRKMEKAFLFGERFEDLTGSHPQRTTRGAIKFISTNVQNASTLTEDVFEDWLRICFRYGGKEKVILCSPKFITVVNSFARGKLKVTTDDNTYGVTMTEYKNAGRKVLLVEHVLFTNDSLTDLSGIAGYALLLDLSDLEMRYLQGRMTQLRENIQAPDVDGEVDEYLSETGLELHQEKKHGLFTGVVS